MFVHIWHLQVLQCYLERQVHPVDLHADHLLQLVAAVASAATALLRVRGLVAEPVIACPFLHVTARMQQMQWLWGHLMGSVLWLTAALRYLCCGDLAEIRVL